MCSGPVLVFGVQEIIGKNLPQAFRHKGLKEALQARGMGPITTADFFDARADWRHDFNTPVPVRKYGSYQTVIDIGCIEHLFDTAQCMKNCMDLIAHGGWYVLITPVRGCFGHSFHVFNPAMIQKALTQNGFQVAYETYTTLYGAEIASPHEAPDVCMAIAAQKISPVSGFKVPQESGWEEFRTPPLGMHAYPKLMHIVRQWTPPALLPLLRRIGRLIYG